MADVAKVVVAVPLVLALLPIIAASFSVITQPDDVTASDKMIEAGGASASRLIERELRVFDHAATLAVLFSPLIAAGYLFWHFRGNF